VFWYNLAKYTKEFGVALWVTTLVSNHYHMIFYLRFGENLGPFMQRLHGATAKQCNDLLPERITPFWCFKGRQTYFDGCLRDAVQVRRTYRYVLTQSTRAGFVSDWRDYPNTRVTSESEAGLSRARERNTFLLHAAYPRYQRSR
jgi:hypothetical protein